MAPSGVSQMAAEPSRHTVKRSTSLGQGRGQRPRAGSADTIADRVEILPNSDSNVIGVEATGPTARGVAPLANAYAQAYIAFRRDAARKELAPAIKVLQPRNHRALRVASNRRTPPVTAIGPSRSATTTLKVGTGQVRRASRRAATEFARSIASNSVSPPP